MDHHGSRPRRTGGVVLGGCRSGDQAMALTKIIGALHLLQPADGSVELEPSVA